MSYFDYEAMTASGRLVRGQLEAQSNEEAAQILKGMNLSIQSIQIAQPPGPASPVSRAEFLLFNQQLASIAKSGLPLEKSLRQLARDAASNRLKKMMSAIADDLEAGTDIEQALAKYKDRFPPLYSRIVAAGVKTGRLGEMLVSLNRHLEISGRTRRILFEALAYPLVIISLAAIILTGFGILIVPSMRHVFTDMGTRLPAVTVTYMDICDKIPEFWITAGVIIFLFFLVKWLMGISSYGRLMRERIFVKIPILGSIFMDISLGRMADTMATLLNSGNDLPAALRMGADASGSHILSGYGELLSSHIEEGRSIARDEIHGETLPSLFLYSLDMGSKRNQLADNMYNLADMYFAQVRTKQSRFRAVLTPFLIVVVGLLVGFGVVALFMPMVSLLVAAG